MEWYYWVIFICPVLLGSGLGMLLDIKYDFDMRSFYLVLRCAFCITRRVCGGSSLLIAG